MNFEISSSNPSYNNQEIEALKRVIEREHPAEGAENSFLSGEILGFMGYEDADIVLTSSGTAALHLSLEALDIEKNDEIIIPSYTCASLLHAVYRAGAKPVVADVDQNSMSLTYDTVVTELTDRTAAIILVHQFGYPVVDDRLFDLKVPVVEDIAQAMGATIGGEHVGREGILAVGSMYATKQISAGYGGFVCSNSDELIDELRDLKKYDGRDEYRVAYNYSLSDLHAALARIQLQKFDEFQAKKRMRVKDYDQVLEKIPSIIIPDRPPGHALYRYVVKSEAADKFESFFQQRGIEVKRPVYRPLHRYQDFPDQLVSEQLHKQVRLLPIHDALSEEEHGRIIETLKDYKYI